MGAERVHMSASAAVPAPAPAYALFYRDLNTRDFGCEPLSFSLRGLSVRKRPVSRATWATLGCGLRRPPLSA